MRYFLLLVMGLPTILPAQTPTSCNGLLALIDRPSVAFSPCTAPAKTVLIENGYSYQQLRPEGFAHVLPQTEVRIGLAANTEIDILPAVYSWQSTPRQAGWGVTNLGLKHIAYFDDQQLVTLQGYVTTPSGGKFYGTRSPEFLLNGIYSINFSSGLGISALLGFASYNEPPVQGNEQFYSFNPIVVIGWPFGERISSYLEFYSQSNTAPDQGWGVNSDIGLIYLLNPHVTLDVTYGHRISGVLNNLNQYVGLGAVVKLG